MCLQGTPSFAGFLQVKVPNLDPIVSSIGIISVNTFVDLILLTVHLLKFSNFVMLIQNFNMHVCKGILQELQTLFCQLSISQAFCLYQLNQSPLSLISRMTAFKILPAVLCSNMVCAVHGLNSPPKTKYTSCMMNVQCRLESHIEGPQQDACCLME